MLLPTRATARAAADLARRHGCDSAFFGAAAPLGLLAPALRDGRASATWSGATHGHETGWVALPGARQLLRRIAGGLDVLTYISEYTRGRLAPALGGRTRLAQLSPGRRRRPVHPGRRRRRGPARGTGWATAPVVVCVSRLVARKGQDVLVGRLAAGARPASRRAAAARRRRPGGGVAAPRGRAAAGSSGSVVLTGPVRARRSCRRTTRPATCSRCRAAPAARGLDVEGLGHRLPGGGGLRPAGGGRHSGGAPEAVQEGVTGHVVDPRSPDAVADAIAGLLDDPARAARDGRGRPGLGRAALVLDDDRRDLRRPARAA